MAGIYIHIPFCRQACHYCDFHFSTTTGYVGEMVQSIVTELSLQRNYLGEDTVNTIYFGGGTPSLLEAGDIAKILSTVYAHFPVIDSAEVTLEANPEDLTTEKLTALKIAGINRLSIGIQSFDDEILRSLNRNHDGKSAIDAFFRAREAGFSNITADLIYAIPGLTDAAWEKDIHRLMNLKPEHVSAYSLTIEDRTVFGNWLRRGKIAAVDDDIAATQLEMLAGILANEGYEHYEVSNFAKPGFYSRHNSSYWKRQKYLGIGPSAHSYDGSSRQFNVPNNHQYIRSIKSGIVPFEREILTREEQINDYLLTTLRTSWGCDLAVLRNELHHDLLGANGDYVSELIVNKFASLDGETLRLTRKGRLLADRISSDLFVTGGT